MSDSVTVSEILTHGEHQQHVVSTEDVGQFLDIEVKTRGTAELALVEEKAYEIYCAARDIATNPDCVGCTVPNLNTDAEVAAAKAAVGVLSTLDQSPPTFTVLGARGVDESTIRVT